MELFDNLALGFGVGSWLGGLADGGSRAGAEDPGTRGNPADDDGGNRDGLFRIESGRG